MVPDKKKNEPKVGEPYPKKKPERSPSTGPPISRWPFNFKITTKQRSKSAEPLTTQPAPSENRSWFWPRMPSWMKSENTDQPENWDEESLSLCFPFSSIKIKILKINS